MQKKLQDGYAAHGSSICENVPLWTQFASIYVKYIKNIVKILLNDQQ